MCSNGQRDCTYDFYEACAVEIDPNHALGYLNATLYTECDHITVRSIRIGNTPKAGLAHSLTGEIVTHFLQCLQTYFDPNTVSQINQCTTDGTATQLCARNGIYSSEISNYYGKSGQYPMMTINEVRFRRSRLDWFCGCLGRFSVPATLAST